MSKLTTEQIEEARLDLAADPSLSIRKIAPRLGVDESTLRRALRRPDAGAGLGVDPDRQIVEVPVIVRDYSHLDELYVYPLGDVHLGAAMHQRDKWEEWVSYLASTPNASMLGTGDFLNAAIVGSKSDVYAELGTADDHVDQLEAQLAPLADDGRLDLLMPGNHEMRIYRAAGVEPMRGVARHLNTPYTRASALVVYRVGGEEYEVYVRHGSGNGQSAAALEKGPRIAYADVFVTGHNHAQMVKRSVVFRREAGRMTRRKQLLLSSGSFLAYEEYAAERGYPPSAIGAPRLFLDGRRRDFHASI